jgi:hypothetical protein
VRCHIAPRSFQTEIQFAASADVGMHGDDLLNQRGARPRHANDEDGHRIGAAEFWRTRDQFGCTAANQAIDLDSKRTWIERSKTPTDVVGGVEMLHGQRVVAKIVGCLADGKVKAQTLRCFQPRRGEGGFHELQ